MLALVKQIGHAAPVRDKLHRASQNPSGINAITAFAGSAPVLSLGNSSKNYKLQETFCCIRALLEYAETAVLSRTRTQGFLRLLLSRLVQEVFVDRIAPRHTLLRMLANWQFLLKPQNEGRASKVRMRQAFALCVYQSELIIF
jgi:hypothetical protein